MNVVVGLHVGDALALRGRTPEARAVAHVPTAEEVRERPVAALLEIAPDERAPDDAPFRVARHAHALDGLTERAADGAPGPRSVETVERFLVGWAIAEVARPIRSLSAYLGEVVRLSSCERCVVGERHQLLVERVDRVEVVRLVVV